MEHAKPAPQRFFQLGYVCDDLGRAIRTLSGGQEPSPFLVIDAVAMGAPADAPVQRLGLAFLGDANIELVEIRTDIESIFRDALPPEGGCVFHHLGYLIDDEADWLELVAAAERDGAVAMAGKVEGALQYLYVDRRADLGHFVEYIHLAEGGRALFASVPRARLGA